RDLRSVRAGLQADIVIGQPDFVTGICNFQYSPQSGNPDAPTQTSLCGPRAVLVDPNGNLYVADTGNGRVLRFPAPFAHQGPLEPADLVLGQSNFTTKITDPSAATMNAPSGLAFSGTNGLVVSDWIHNRALYFPMTNGTFDPSQSGMAATK